MKTFIENLQELSDRQHSTFLAQSTVSGLQRQILSGSWPFAATPYGYQKVYVGAEKASTMPNGRPRNGRVNLITKPEEAQIVQQIFIWFVRHDRSLRHIAAELTFREVPGQRGSPSHWTGASIKRILSNFAYLGIIAIGFRKRKTAALQHVSPTKLRGSFPPLVDEETFHAAAVKLSIQRNIWARIHAKVQVAATSSLDLAS
jgi:hypothetical protein